MINAPFGGISSTGLEMPYISWQKSLLIDLIAVVCVAHVHSKIL